MYKAAIVLALAAVVSAGNVAYLDHHIGSTAEQTVRGFGGQSSISQQARTVNSAFSTSSAYKNKVTNNAVYASPLAYAAPVAQYAAAPVAHYAAAPVAQYAAAPVAQYAAAPVAHYAAAPVAHYAAAPVAQYAAAPAYARALPVATKVAHPAGLLGVAYSPVVPGVATYSFDGFGVHYGY